MIISKPGNLACPIDREALSIVDGARYVCSQGHSFDIARQGYVNLLPVQHKRSKQPGDTKEMVVARQSFLDIGAYEPISNTLNRQVLRHIDTLVAKGCRNIDILDAGCGEGYYLSQLYGALVAAPERDNVQISLSGFDISKEAILQACKRRQGDDGRDIFWSVATNKLPPVTRQSVDVLICMFGFPVYEAFANILKPGGILILVEAGNNHLLEIKKMIYSDIYHKDQAKNIRQSSAGFFTLDDHQELKFKFRPHDSDAYINLLKMTPFYYRLDLNSYLTKMGDHDISAEIEFITLSPA